MPSSLRPWFLSISTGVLLVLTFPKFKLDFLGWVALAPLLLALDRAPSMKRAAALGYVSGFVFFAGTVYWVRIAMLEYGGLGRVTALLVLLAFVGVLALFFALFAAPAWLILKLPERHIFWGLPALWVGVELVRAHIFTGFPWLLLGYALTDQLLIAQLARMGGVYLLSFVLALFSTGILLVARNPVRRRGMALAGGFFVLAAASLAGGFLSNPPATETVYLVQSLVSMKEDWSGERVNKLLTDLQSRILSAYARNEARSGLVLWPEMPASLYYQDDALVRERLHHLARQTQSRMLVNVIAFADAERQKPLNSVVLIGPEGDYQGRYDKIHLVPFGEYVPLKDLFFFAGKLTAEVGDFVPGTRPAPLGMKAPLAPLICYEGIFPDLVRRFTARDAAVLVNVSNDGWYGQSAARDQLLLMARMRAIENDRWLLRATNTGITAIVDPAGRVRTFAPGERAVYAGRYGNRTGRTMFVAFGHWFSLLAALAAAALAVQGLRISRRQREAVETGPAAAR